MATNQKSVGMNKGLHLPLLREYESERIQINRGCGLVIWALFPGVCCWSDLALWLVSGKKHAASSGPHCPTPAGTTCKVPGLRRLLLIRSLC